MASDLLLAIEMLVLTGAFRYRSGLQRLLWAAYWGGLGLILLGSLRLATI